MEFTIGDGGRVEEVAENMFVVRLTTALPDQAAFSKLLDVLYKHGCGVGYQSRPFGGATVNSHRGESNRFGSSYDLKPTWSDDLAQHSFKFVTDQLVFVVKFHRFNNCYGDSDSHDSCEE